jgi:hypothetical protein
MTDTTPSDSPAQPQRDNWGRLVQGHKVSVGNRGGGNAHKVAALNRALLDCASPETVAELFDLTLKRARDGDNVCLMYLLNKLTGRPAQSIEVTQADRGIDTGQGTRLTAIFLSVIGDDLEKRAKFAAALRGEPSLATEVDANES